MTCKAKVRCTEAEIVSLVLATVTALPPKELCAMLRTLQLSLRGATATDQLHGQGGLHIIVELLLVLLGASTLDLSSIVRLVALRALEKRHFLHGQTSEAVLITRVARFWGWPTLFDRPTL